MKHLNLVLLLVSEWPLGPPRFPVKKVVCGTCGKDVWLEITPSYLLVSEGVEIKFSCTDCARVESESEVARSNSNVESAESL